MDPSLNLPRLDVIALLRQNGIRPDKRLGQNFLIDEPILRRITEAAQLECTDTVLELGAGLGSLTRHLAIHAQSVVAVEIDPKLIPVLKKVISQFENIRVIEGDILSLDPLQFIPPSGYLTVANIPYYITSAIIRHLLEAKVQPSRMILTVQQEVAKRICASPGDMSLLALSVQVYGTPHQLFRIPSTAFYPSPEVESEVVQIDLLPSPRIALPLLDTFFALIKAGFSQKRKTLRNALSGGLNLQPAVAESLLDDVHIEPRRRAETLSLDEWSLLTDRYHQDLYG